MHLRPRHSAASTSNDGARMTEWFSIGPVRRAAADNNRWSQTATTTDR
jgi:hypothetical protein